MEKRPFLFCLGSGLLLALSFPPLKFGFLAYVGLLPLFFLIDTDSRRIASLKNGFLTGLFFNLGTIYWIAWDTEPGLFVIIPATIAVALILSLFFVVFSLCLSYLRGKTGELAFLVTPFLWTAIEYLRSLGVLAFPWTSLAYSQSYYLPFIQFVSFTSAYGISFWIVTLNVLFYYWIKKALNRKTFVFIFILLVVLFLGPYLYGRSVMSKNLPEPEFRIALIQGNIDPRVKWDTQYRRNNLDIYVEKTEALENEQLDLIVWPETAIPVYLAFEEAYRKDIQQLTDSVNVPIITGAPHYKYDHEHNYSFYNSAFLFSPAQKRLQEYAKIHLVPFSERMPFQTIFPFLKEMNFGQANFSPGTEYTLFEIQQRKFAVLICFESIFPQLVREFVRHNADFLVNITNDAWFGKTSSPFQHARIAIFRAIENRIGLARCANTGVSMIIDPYGQVYNETKIFTESSVIGNVYFKKDETFYTKYGDVFSQACVIVSLGWLLLSLFTRRWSLLGNSQFSRNEVM